MPVIMENEQFPEMPVILMIVGTPFSYKTSMATTAHNAILIDGDRGAQRAIRKCPVLQVKNWDEVRDEDAAGLFKSKSTVILDTPKSLLDDFIWDWCQRQKFQLDDRKVYGAIATEFKSFTAKRRLEGSDIIIVSHEKSTEKKGGTVYEPDITGGTKQLLLRMCDQIGFMEKREVKLPNGKNSIQTVLTFNPTPEWPFCKNFAALEDIIIPSFNDEGWKTFMNDRVIEPMKKALSSMSEEQRAALEIIADWHATIDAITAPQGDDLGATGKQLHELYLKIVEITPEALKKQITAYFVSNNKKIGYKWDKEAGSFVPAVPVVAGEVKPETPAQPDAEVKAEQTAAPVASAAPPAAQSNPDGLMPQASTPSIAIPVGTPVTEEKDLFDPAP